MNALRSALAWKRGERQRAPDLRFAAVSAPGIGFGPNALPLPAVAHVDAPNYKKAMTRERSRQGRR